MALDDKGRCMQNIKEQGAEPSSLRQLIEEARPWWRVLAVALSLCVVQGMSTPGGALLSNFVYTVFSAQTDELMSSYADISLYAWIGFGVLMGCASFGSITLFSYFMEGTTMQLRMRTFKHLMSQSVAYFDKPEHATGKLSVRLSTDSQNVRNALDWRLGQMMESIISLVAGVTIALLINWQLALIVIALWPMLFIVEMYHFKARQSFAESDRKLNEEAGKILTDVVANMRTVQALGCEHQFIQEYGVHLAQLYKHAVKQALFQAFSVSLFMASTILFSGVCVYVGSWLVLANIITPIKIFQVLNPVQMCAAPIGFAVSYFPEFFKARMSMGLIANILNDKSEIDNWSESGAKPDINGALEVIDVNFAYESRKDIPILKEICLDIKQGTTLALVGPSGCGKSTIVSLLERFYDADEGQLLIDNHENKSLHIGYMRSCMSLVQQEPTLFDCSIMENIMYGMESGSRADAIQCAMNANIHSFVQSLPEGYETRVGEKGTQLSGGQKQRIAIARSLMRNPTILLLDEATSALDTESEKIVQAALDSARTGRTCVMIAHRLSTVQNADHIAVVRQGEVVEYGNHQQLMSKKGIYCEMVGKQVVDKKDKHV